ncbi:MAG: RICIN domain-containing protein [Atopobiaceae bacterium]|nr:RICIN domain-containing protein [Atopobiaceae bacterium]
MGGEVIHSMMKRRIVAIVLLVSAFVISGLAAQIAHAAPSGYGYVWPVKNSAAPITAGLYYSDGSYHGATDIGVGVGTEIIASKAGTVALTQAWDGYTTSGMQSYGNLVILNHPDGTQTYYAHLSQILVSNGQAVAQGQRIALSGKTGNVTGPHLHFEIRENGNRVDPQTRVSPANQFANESEAPVISDFWVGELREDRFTVLAKVTDNAAMGHVNYAIWSDKGGQDDLVWHPAACTDNNDIYWAWVYFKDHNNERGNYIIHAYATDAAGNETSKGLSYYFDSDGPVISNVSVTDVWASGYTVTCTVTDDTGVNRVQFPTWTLNADQDDIVADWYSNPSMTGSRNGDTWTFKVWAKDHNYETGNYATHIYAIDSLGNQSVYTTGANVDVSGNDTSLPEGRYSIRSAVDSSRAVDVNGCSMVDQGNVALWQRTSGTNQQFDIAKFGEWSYTITAVHSGKAIENYYASVDLGANISQYTFNQTVAQRWVPVANDDGTYSFRNRVNGYYMDLEDAGTENGTNIRLWQGNGTLQQKWYLVPVDASRWTISIDDQEYSGTELRPKPSVMAGSLQLIEGVDYELSYQSNAAPGIGKVIVTGTNGYTGSKEATFNITSAHKHEADESVRENVVSPTCMNDGSYDSVIYCAGCGDELSRETVKVDKLGHDAGRPVEENRHEPTCSEAGSYDLVTYCTRCGEELDREAKALPKADHTPTGPVEENRVEATCKNAGSYDLVTCCKVCGAELEREAVAIPKAEHAWDEGVVTTQPTCTGSGVKTFTCTRCGATKTEEVESTGHKPATPVSENASASSNCEAGGTYDEVVYCETCHEELSREHKTQQAGQHVPVTDTAVAPTCTEEGLTEGSHCSVCGAVLVAQEKISVLGHDGETVEAVTPTCTAPGTTAGVRCKRCGEVLEGCEAIAARGHNYKETVVGPTCAQFGYTEHKCSRCGDTYVTDRVPAKSHTAGEPEVESEEPATCELAGTRSLVTKCADCGKVLYRSTEVVPATGHKAGEPEVESDTKATCEGAGRKVIVTKCKDCGYEISRAVEVTPAKGHEAGEPEVVSEAPATCDENGTRTSVTHCKTCGKELSRESVIVPAKGHSWDGGKVTKQPTCTTEGTKEFTCEACGVKTNERVAKAAHTPRAEEHENEVASTCKAAGHYDAVTHCEHCGVELSRKTVALPLASHTWGNWTMVLEPTYEREGMELRTCEVCFLSETRPVEKPILPSKTAIDTAEITVATATYTGSPLEPAVTVKLSGKTLVRGTDYELAFSNNKNAGTATVTVTGKGDYEGVKPVSWTIAKAAQTVTAANKSVLVSKTVSIGATASAGGKLTYKTSDAKIATVSAAGVVTGVAAGTAKITITAAATENYKSASKVVTVTVNKAAQTITAADKSVVFGKTVSLGAKMSGDGKLTYKSSNTAIAKVSATGVVTPVAKGTAKITITAAETAKCKAATKTITVTVTQAAQTITAANKVVQVKKTVSLAAKTSGNGKLTYKSSNTAVATVSATGVVTGKKVGTAKITITAAATGQYKQATKTITVTVKNANTLTSKAKKATVAASFTTLKSKAVTLASNVTVTGAKGTVSYANASTDATAKKFKVDAATGKITVPKGTKKGKYQVKVKVTAKGNATYLAGSKTVSYYIQVK